VRWRSLAPGLFAAACAVHLAHPPAAWADEPSPPSVPQCLSASEHGQLDRDDGRYVRAREALLTCSSSACPPVVQRDCVKWLAEIDATMPTLVFVVRNAAGSDLREVVVRVDGQVLLSRLDGKPVAVDPGEHELTFEAGGRRVQTRALVNVGERNRIVKVSLDAEPGSGVVPPPSSAPAVPIGPVVLGGVALLAFGTSAVLWLSASSDLRSLESAPCAASRTCAESDVQSVRTRLVVGDVVAGVGLAALGAAAILFLTRDRSVAMSFGPGILRAEKVF
jgi:hypothetical protein